MQQQRLLAARPAGQDAVDAEHPSGHHGEEKADDESLFLAKIVPRRGATLSKVRHGRSDTAFFLHARLRQLTSGMRMDFFFFTGSSRVEGLLFIAR